jgi:cytochrome c oxidase accessory protein FixG
MCPGCSSAFAIAKATAVPPGQPALTDLVEQARHAVSVTPNLPEFADEEPLYTARKKIYPQHVSGTFRRLKWALLVAGMSIYYFLPFVRWDRGPNAPDQAVLIDFSTRRFYFFFIEIWPQEVYYLTGLLIIAAMTLFLMNAIAGRIWCGYLCPQTVWTDLFVTIERWIEGDRREHLLRDQQPWTFERAARTASTHFWWLMIAWWTGGAWVLYFADAPTLVKNLATFQAPIAAYAFIGMLTFTTYTLAGWMREQVCVYMCPWPRIQAALTDEYALNVTYRYDRGEPRASLKKAVVLHAEGKPAGDCVECLQCVHVCPTGVDIRQGPDLGCIQCGLCIDACDAVMAKIGRPARLIAYDTDLNIKRRQQGQQPVYNLVRTRTLLYAAIIVLVGGVMAFAMATRRNDGISVIHDRNPLFVRLSDGAVRNGYAIRILNKTVEAQSYTLKVFGLADAAVEVIGSAAQSQGESVVDVGPDQTREMRVLVTTHQQLAPAASIPLTFSIVSTTGGPVASAADHFIGP